MALLALTKGFTIGLSMIVPIGVQNSFVLNQGIKRNFHYTAALICIACDLILMSIGVFGGGALINSNEILATVITWGGILFLAVYGAIFLKEALFYKSDNNTALAKPLTRTAVILTTLAVTLLNPHVYLDTVMIIGSISSQFAFEHEKWAFLLGTCLASIVWFYLLSSSAAKMAPWLSKINVQRCINFVIGLLMWSIAFSLFK
jgi:L-lysine exporter family protein LysE/ArgO